ncbi:MAG TPA: cyclase family protein [Ktedonobacteraceae bacterium]|jgi:kynurenine formamidase|nr:cyclase family protein [Ktedonobacteraceae bacterium]
MNIPSNARVYDLEQPRYFGAPVLASHAPGYVYTLHRHHEPGTAERRTSASGFMYTTEHSGTHIDALCHQAEDVHLYGRREINPSIQTSQGFTELGAETITPIITRGVLLDVARHRGVDRIGSGDQIRQSELETVARNQGTAIGEGDVVLVRTGNGATWQDPTTYLQAGGVSGDASSWLASLRVRAVGADNIAWDELGVIDPDLQVTLPGHLILLVRHGIYIVENLFLEELAREQCYEFTFICLPLKLRGATGSPVRPIAIV